MKKKALLLLPFFVLTSCGNNPSSGSISGLSSGSSSIDESISYSQPPIPSWSVAAPPEAKVSDFTLDYHDDWGGYYVSDYKGSMESFQIPSAGQGDHGVAPIVGISSFAFAKRTGVKRIALHDNLRRIEPSAFAESGLEELYVTSGLVDVSVSSFEGTKLKIHGYGGVWFLPGLDFEYKYAYGVKDDTETAVLPEGCVGICKDAFKNYKKNVVFPKTLAVLPEGWGNEAVANNTYFAGELTGFRYAGPSAFEGVLRLKNLRIGKDGIRVCSYAFSSIPLFKTAVISTEVMLEQYAFSTNKRLQVYVAGSQDAVSEKWNDYWFNDYYRKPIYGVSNDYEPIVVDGFEVYAPTSSGEVSAVAYRGEQTEIALPETLSINGRARDVKYVRGCFAGSNATVTTLSKANFEISAWRYGSVQKIVLGKSYKASSDPASTFNQSGFDGTGVTAFEVASGNEDFSVYEGVLYSKDGKTLYRCPNVAAKTFTIPKSVTRVEDYAFSGCNQIKDIYFGKGGSISFGVNCFWLSNVTTAHYQGSIAQWLSDELGRQVGTDVDLGTKTVSIPSSVTSLPSYAFQHCRYVTSVSIPSSITKIPHSMFRSCSSLTSVSFPNGLKEIEDGTFTYCTSLRKVIIPSSVETIHWLDAFDGVKGLTVYFRSSTRPKYWSGYAEDSAYKNVTFVYGYTGN
ncbi:MAG: hypothetical protein E7179_02295 [Erysipelotrichaceae bacterium]|jgi:hypothetical protein|nr:hypothetical protein [Erysipelotrichaceae bacterium]